MSIKCKSCLYKMSTFEFLGHMTAEVFLILKERLKVRGLLDDWNQFMAGFSRNMQITCPMCKACDWLPDDELADQPSETNIMSKDQKHVE